MKKLFLVLGLIASLGASGQTTKRTDSLDQASTVVSTDEVIGNMGGGTKRARLSVIQAYLSNFFSPLSHTHAPSQITQSGAATGNYMAWSGTAWAPLSPPAIPSQFNPIAGTNITLTGTYPNITFSSVGGGSGTTYTGANGVSVSGSVISLADVPFTSANQAKLNGVAVGATANSPDAQLRDRGTHTGTQAMSTVSGLVDTISIIKNKLPSSLNVLDFGATPDDTTDDSQAIKNAILASIQRGSKQIIVPSGKYLIKCPLQTVYDGVPVNCQICFPNVISGTSMPRIEIVGEVAPNWASEVIDGSGRNVRGVIFESTIIGTGTRPSVFGSAYYSAGFGNFSFLYVDFKNIVIQTRTKTNGAEIAPTMSGIDASHLSAVTFYRTCVQTESVPPDLLTPTGTYGIILPLANNKAVVNIAESKIEGFDVGLQMSEHVVATDIIIDGCINGIELLAAPHGCSISHCKLEGNKNNIVVNGNADLSIFNYDSEHYLGGEFYSFEKDVKFVSGINNRLSIFNSSVIKSFVGKVNEFIADPAVKYRVFNGAGENVEYAGGAPTDPNVLLDKTWDDLTGWTISSPSPAIIEIAQNLGENSLHMSRNGTAYNNASKNIAYTPGDKLLVSFTGVTYGSGGNIQILLSDGNNPYGSVDLPAGTGSVVINTTGFPAGALAFYLNNTQGEGFIRSIKVEKQP